MKKFIVAKQNYGETKITLELMEVNNLTEVLLGLATEMGDELEKEEHEKDIIESFYLDFQSDFIITIAELTPFGSLLLVFPPTFKEN